MTPPEGMSLDLYRRILATPWNDTRMVCCPILERAAIRHYEGGEDWETADAAAFRDEAPGQRPLF